MSAYLMTSTYSMWSLFRNCRKAVDWRYIQQLVGLERDGNLHFGTLVHQCLELWQQCRDLGRVLDLIGTLCPNRLYDEGQRRDWHNATAMMKAYAARYAAEEFEVVALEKTFQGPIVNPATGAASRSFVLGGKDDGIDHLIKSGYQLLNLITYFTTGEDESRAWTIVRGSTTPVAGQAIHTDFRDKFIRAEVVFWKDLLENLSVVIMRASSLLSE